MDRKRETNYDLLRVMSMLAVIVIHVSEIWICGLPVYKEETGMMIDQMQAVFACVLKSMSGFAVPCFIMLSGAFNLSDERNREYRYFYGKIFRKIGTHTLIFSVLYFCYRSLFCFIGDHAGMAEFLVVLKDLLKGEPMGHMGYLYRMAFIYLLVPVVFRLKNQVSERTVPLLSIACFFLAKAVSWLTAENPILAELDIGQTIEYMGYFLLGYVIRKFVSPNMVGGMICIVLGIFIEMRTGVTRYSEIFLGIQERGFGIAAMFAYVLIFVGFTMVSVKERMLITKLTNLSFIVYLVHQGVNDVLGKTLYHVISPYYYIEMHSFIWIPLLTMTVLLGSIALAYLYNWIYTKVKI